MRGALITTGMYLLDPAGRVSGRPRGHATGRMLRE
jgi:hypothetical protein